MSTDLSTALRDAVADPRVEGPDTRAVLAAGTRRVRRRAALTVGASALTMAAVATTVAVVSNGPDQEIRPARVVQIDLDDAEDLELEAMTSLRTTWHEHGSYVDHDRFDGLTADGFALRSRYTQDGAGYELGLTDPVTERTDWLPKPPANVKMVVEMTADRLVLLGGDAPWPRHLMVFDRAARTWQDSPIRLAGGLEAHVPFRVVIGTDGRLYLGSTFERQSTPMQWWSYSVPEGGVGRPEPTLAGAGVARQDGVQVRADGDGRVVVSASGGEQVVAEKRPPGCAVPSDPDLVTVTPVVGLAGNRAVVSYLCPEDRFLTFVYDPDNGDVVQLDGYLLAADGDHVLLAPARGAPPGTYLFDVSRRSLARIGPKIRDGQPDLENGLALWSTVGPLEDDSTNDAIWKVAALPSDD